MAYAGGICFAIVFARKIDYPRPRAPRETVPKISSSVILFFEENAPRQSILMSQKTGFHDRDLKSPPPRKILDTPLDPVSVILLISFSEKLSKPCRSSKPFRVRWPKLLMTSPSSDLFP